MQSNSSASVLRSRCVALCIILLAASSCSSRDSEEIALHIHRGDQYVEQQKFSEALIEYKNAARAAPNDAAVQWKLAQASLKTKEFATAVAALQRVTVLDPSHYDAKVSLGHLWLAAVRVVEARKAAEDLIAQHPGLPTGYLLKGALAAQERDLPAAIVQFQHAVERDPNNDATMVTLGHLYLLQRESHQAVAWYERALAANLHSIEARVARGNYYFSIGRSDEGDKDFDTAAELAKESEDTRLAIAMQHLTHGRPQHAERDLKAVADAMQSRNAQRLLAELKLELGKVPDAKSLVAALAKDPKPDAGLVYLQGRIALAEQRHDDARRLLEEAVARAPGMAAVHMYLGVLDLLEGRQAHGEEQLLEAVKLDPADPKPHLVLAEFYLGIGSYARAEREAFEVLRRNPAHVQAAILYGDSFLLRDEWGTAEAVYSALLTQLPESPIGPTKMAILKRRQGFTTQAADFFAEAVKRSPRDPALMGEYLMALIAAEKVSKAESLLKDYMTKAPKDPGRWEIAARVHMAMRHPADAEQALKKAIELAPDHPHPLYELAQFYLSQNKLAAAEAGFRSVLERDPNWAVAHTSLGLVLTAQAKLDEGSEHYRRAVELEPKDYVAANNLAASLLDNGAALDEAFRYGKLALEAAPTVPAVQDTVGWIYLKQGALDQAYPLLSRAAGALADNPTVRYHHAKALAQRGDKEMAVLELEAALGLSKTFPGADDAATTLASLRE